MAGGCGGIGSAFVLRFVNDGAMVAVLDLDTSNSKELIEAVGSMTTPENKSKVKSHLNTDFI